MSVPSALSSRWICAHGLEPLQGGKHFFSEILAAGGLREPTMAEVAECAHDVLYLGHCSGILRLYLCDLRFEALAGFSDARVNGCDGVRLPAAMARELVGLAGMREHIHSVLDYLLFHLKGDRV
jgi:hypothetical protein